MYLGMELLLIGLAIYTDTPYGWLVALIFPIVIHNLFIVKEEQQMIDTFGDDYIEYRGRVRRWI
jgi:protein-S-isoprenylcysteine O-methyltransferase Ste14